MAHIAPAAVVFVPSVGGLSHHPREHNAPADLARGVNALQGVLLDALLNVLRDSLLRLAAET